MQAKPFFQDSPTRQNCLTACWRRRVETSFATLGSCTGHFTMSGPEADTCIGSEWSRKPQMYRQEFAPRPSECSPPRTFQSMTGALVQDRKPDTWVSAPGRSESKSSSLSGCNSPAQPFRRAQFLSPIRTFGVFGMDGLPKSRPPAKGTTVSRSP